MITNDKTAGDERAAFPKYCLLCEKQGHRTNECWSTQVVNARWNEIASLTTPSKEPAGAVLSPPIECTTCGALVVGVAPLTSAPAEPADPMDWPLPCDVTVGHGTMRKGVSLRVLVMRMKSLYEMATGNDADTVANRTPEERQALASKFLAAIYDPRPLHEQIAEVRRRERPSAEVLNMVVGIPAETPPAAGAIDAREQSPDDELLVACITLDGTTLTVEANALADMFGTDDEQHTYGLTFKRMTRAAYEALGEFNGF